MPVEESTLTYRYYIILFFLAAVLKGTAQSSIEFVENKGQWDPRVKFKGDISVGSFFLEQMGFSVHLYSVTDLNRITNEHHGVYADASGGSGSGAAGGTVPGGAAGGGSATQRKEPDQVEKGAM